jgi:hypothetical protein
VEKRHAQHITKLEGLGLEGAQAHPAERFAARKPAKTRTVLLGDGHAFPRTLAQRPPRRRIDTSPSACSAGAAVRASTPGVLPALFGPGGVDRWTTHESGPLRGPLAILCGGDFLHHWLLDP